MSADIDSKSLTDKELRIMARSLSSMKLRGDPNGAFLGNGSVQPADIRAAKLASALFELLAYRSFARSEKFSALLGQKNETA